MYRSVVVNHSIERIDISPVAIIEPQSGIGRYKKRERIAGFACPRVYPLEQYGHYAT